MIDKRSHLLGVRKANCAVQEEYLQERGITDIIGKIKEHRNKKGKTIALHKTVL